MITHALFRITSDSQGVRLFKSTLYKQLSSISSGFMITNFGFFYDYLLLCKKIIRTFNSINILHLCNKNTELLNTLFDVHLTSQVFNRDSNYCLVKVNLLKCFANEFKYKLHETYLVNHVPCKRHVIDLQTIENSSFETQTALLLFHWYMHCREKSSLSALLLCLKKVIN